MFDKDHRKTALIVAAGPSAAIMRTLRVNKREVAVIAVNGALDWLPWFDYWFTLDPTKVNRKRMRTFRHNGKYFIAYPKNRVLLPSYVTRLERFSAPSPKDAEPIIDGKYACAIGLNETPNTINSGNSSFGALGLAYHLGFERVGLIGVDASDAQRLDGGYSRDLAHLPDLFESAMGQIDIVNCGDMNSAIPTMDLKEFIAGVPHLSSKRIVSHGKEAAMREQGIRLKQYERRLEQLQFAGVSPAPVVDTPVILGIDPITLTPLIQHANSDTAAEVPTDSNLVLHENLEVRGEGSNASLSLSQLTTVV